MNDPAPAIQALLAKGRERGKVTLAELSKAVPPDFSSAEQIEAVVALLQGEDIQIVEK